MQRIRSRKIARAKRETDRLRFAGHERDARETLQRLHRTRRAGDIVAQIELDDLLDRMRARIANGKADLQHAIRCQPLARQLQPRIANRRIAETMAERIKRSPRRIHIFGAVPLAFAGRSPRAASVIMDRNLTDGSREAHRQAARGAGVAEQDVGERVPRFDARIPGP